MSELPGFPGANPDSAAQDINELGLKAGFQKFMEDLVRSPSIEHTILNKNHIYLPGDLPDL